MPEYWLPFVQKGALHVKAKNKKAVEDWDFEILDERDHETDYDYEKLEEVKP